MRFLRAARLSFNSRPGGGDENARPRGLADHRLRVRSPSSYTPTEAEWLQLQQGGAPTDTYEWFLAASVSAAGSDGQVPAGVPWCSNLRSFTVRTLHIRITWTPLGADVDLHLKPPTGEDIAYYDRTPGWGVLDRDCISSCTEENISLIYVPTTGTYRAFAHYFSDHGKGPATVEAQVFHAAHAAGDHARLRGTLGVAGTCERQARASRAGDARLRLGAVGSRSRHRARGHADRVAGASASARCPASAR